MDRKAYKGGMKEIQYRTTVQENKAQRDAKDAHLEIHVLVKTILFFCTWSGPLPSAQSFTVCYDFPLL